MVSRPRVAIAHDYVTQRGGAERVVLAILRAFPDAKLHTTFYNPETTYPEFGDYDIRVSPANRAAPLRVDPRRALPILAGLSSQMKIDADVVIASSSGWAHAFPTTGARIVYCHSPARWLYESADYLGDAPRLSPKRLALGALKRPLLAWDGSAAAKVDTYFANARVIQDRISRAYGRESELLGPPTTFATEGPVEGVGELADWGDKGFTLLVSRLMPYKNVDLAIEAVRGTDRRLVIVGFGPERERLRTLLPDNARIVSDLSEAQLRWCYQRAHLLLAPSREDFGLTPLEANRFGVPTVALRAGGYLDTVAEGVSGEYFDDVDPDLIRAALVRADGREWQRSAVEANAARFSEAAFAQRLRDEVERLA
ncbi:glycosyltransferase [Ornithinimicrobium sp. Arc0846-15]|nr:glycosyltransferase [Ornithinimicrobium laminariae]